MDCRSVFEGDLFESSLDLQRHQMQEVVHGLQVSV